MPTTVLLNGQKLDLSANPDLLFEILLTLTNLEEGMNSIDKRLYNVEKKQKNQSSSPYLVKKRSS